MKTTKRLFIFVLSLIMLFSLAVFAQAADDSSTAEVSAQDFYVNGKRIVCDKYNIGGENYFKLRDLTVTLNGTPYQFEVGYDAAALTVDITTGKTYTANGSELVAGKDCSSSCVSSNWRLKVNGEDVDVTAYNLGGNNYFKLRDLGDLIGFGVKYDPILNAAVVTAAENILLIHITNREVGINEAYFDEFFKEGNAAEGIEAILNAGQYYINGIAVPASADETDCFIQPLPQKLGQDCGGETGAVV